MDVFNDTLELIKNTLTAKNMNYVKLDKNGIIDAGLFKKKPLKI